MSIFSQSYRFRSPIVRKRFIAVILAASFAVYMYLLHSAHSAHASKTSFSPTCQPVVAESFRAIQILKELQDRMHVVSRHEKSDFASPFDVVDRSFWGYLLRLVWHSKLDVRALT
jgi:hypothetical protein